MCHLLLLFLFLIFCNCNQKVKKFTNTVSENNQIIRTCDKVDKVPGVVVEDGLEVLDKLLDDGLHHHPIVVPGLHADHHLAEEEIKFSESLFAHRSFAITAKVPNETTLQEEPHLCRVGAAFLIKLFVRAKTDGW